MFAISLFLPIFYRSDGVHRAPGWAALAYGWVAMHPAWLANPLWLAGLIVLLCKRYLAAAILATLGLLLALSSFSLVGGKMWTGDLSITALSAGYYVWLASQVILAGGAFALWRSASAAKAGVADQP
ncbi:MAG: hypothetical protein AAGK09_06235 [Planctomycetota bacterium]